jgi:Domain of unknown function (DUF4157)
MHALPGHMERLQQSIGNRAVERLLASSEEAGVRSLPGAQERESGAPLDTSARIEMESRFGEDFSRVRVHTGPDAAASAREAQAKAYTVGTEILFGDRRYDPATRRGKWLLAHELTHVVQQKRGGASPALDSNAPHEQEARQAANAILAGEPEVKILAGTAVGIARAGEGGHDEDDDFVEDYEPNPLIRAQKRRIAEKTKERGHAIQEEFEAFKLNDESARVAPERLGKRKESSEKARHKSRDEEQQGHHGHPKFLGGLEEQTKVMMPRWLHETYHGALYDVLEKEFQRVRPSEQPSRRYYGAFFSRLSKKEQNEVVRAVMNHAREFDEKFHSQYTDKRTRLTAALRRGIREAKQEAKQEAGKKSAKPLPSAPPPTTGTTKKPSTPGGGAGAGGTSKSVTTTPPATTGKKTRPAKSTASGAAATVSDETTETKEKPKVIRRPATLKQTGATSKVETETEKSAEAPAPQQQVKVTPAQKGAESAKIIPSPKVALAAATPVTKKAVEEQTTDPSATHVPPTPDVATQKPGPKAKTPAVPTPPATAGEEQKTAVSKPAPAGKTEAPPPPKPVPPVAQQQTKPSVTPSAVILPSKPPTTSVKAAKPETTTSATGSRSQTTPPPIAPGVTPKTPTGTPQTLRSKTGSKGGAPEQQTGSEKSSSREVSRGASLIAGPDKLGVGGNVGVGATQAHGHGLETSQSVSFGGKVVIHSEEVPNTSPKRYRVTLTIDLSGAASVGASRSDEGRVGGGISGSASGSLRMSVTHELTAEQSQKYIDAAKNGTGGAQQELQIARMVKDGSIDEAKAYLAHRKSLADTPEAAEDLEEGDLVTVSEGGKLEGKAGLSGSKSGGGPKIGGEFGLSRSGELTRTKAKKDGKFIYTVTVVSGKGTTVGGSFSQGVAGMGLSQEGTESKSKSVTFILDPKDPNFKALSREVLGADTVDDLSKLAARRPELTGETTTGHGTSSSLTTSASVAGVGLSVNEATSYSEEETKSARGVSHKYEGSGTLGGSLTVAGKKVAGSSKTDKFTGEVGPDNKATGETSSTQTETDYLGTIKKIAEHPLGSAGALATGGSPVLQEKSEVEGKKLTDDSYSRLAELAKDPAAWEHSWSGSTRIIDDWRATRRKVLAANGDRNLIAKAMAEFESGGSGRSRTVEKAISETGIAFDFPEELKDQKQVYDELVAGDPFSRPRELASAGKPQEAISELNSVNERLGKMMTGLQAHQEQVQNVAALGEMMRRISDQRTKVRAEIRSLSPQSTEKRAPGSADAKGKGQPSKEDVERQEKEREVALKREEQSAKVNDFVTTLQTNRHREQAKFNVVYEELKKESSWFSKPDVIVIAYNLNDLLPLYDQWDKTVAQLKELFTERGEANPDRAKGYGPNRTEWNALHKRVFIY